MRSAALLLIAASLFTANDDEPRQEKPEQLGDLNGTVAAQFTDHIGTIRGFNNTSVSVDAAFMWTVRTDQLQIKAVTTQPLSRSVTCSVPLAEIEKFATALGHVADIVSHDFDEKFDSMTVMYTTSQGLNLSVQKTPSDLMYIVGEKRFVTVIYQGLSVNLQASSINELKNLVLSAQKRLQSRTAEVDEMSEK